MKNFNNESILNVNRIVPFNGYTRSSQYMHTSIAQTINKTMKYELSVMLSLNIEKFISKNKPINIFVYGQTKEETSNYMQKVLFIIYTYISYIIHLHGNYIKFTNLDIYIYLYDKGKEITGKNKPLTKQNVSSGYTYMYIDGNNNEKCEIVVYRKEEIIKVLIHELTHCFEIDELVIPNRLLNELSEIFMLNNDIHIKESITEFWTCFVNIMYYTILDNGKITNETEFKLEVMKNIEKEKIFLLKQANKIGFIQDHCWKRKKVLTEQIHVVSYYIIKAIMFMKYDEYLLDYLSPNTKKYFITNIVKDIKNNFTLICDTGLRMTSLDVDGKMNNLKLYKDV